MSLNELPTCVEGHQGGREMLLCDGVRHEPHVELLGPVLVRRVDHEKHFNNFRD